MDRDGNLTVLYQTLRAEISQADNQNYQVLGFAVAATAALVTAGISQESVLNRSVVFALVFLVTWPCQRLLQGKRKYVWRIASYLRTVVEPQLPGVKWETHIDLLSRRSQYARVLSTRAAHNEWLIIAVLNAVAGICIVTLGIFPAETAQSTKAWLVGLVVFGWLTLTVGMRVVDRRLSRGHGGGINATYETAWRELIDTVPVVPSQGDAVHIRQE